MTATFKISRSTPGTPLLHTTS